MIWIRFGARGAVLYMIGYFLALAPVLIISKYETQYLYAPSLAVSVAVALIWRPEIAYALPTIGIGAPAPARQGSLQPPQAALSATSWNDDPILYGPDNAPWWVAARPLYGVPVRIGEREINVKFAHQPDGAALKLLPDCTVVKNGAESQ